MQGQSEPSQFVKQLLLDNTRLFYHEPTNKNRRFTNSFEAHYMRLASHSQEALAFEPDATSGDKAKWGLSKNDGVVDVFQAHMNLRGKQTWFYDFPEGSEDPRAC